MLCQLKYSTTRCASRFAHAPGQAGSPANRLMAFRQGAEKPSGSIGSWGGAA